MGDAIHVMAAQPDLWWWYGEAQPEWLADCLYRLSLVCALSSVGYILYRYTLRRSSFYLRSCQEALQQRFRYLKIPLIFLNQYNSNIKVGH